MRNADDDVIEAFLGTNAVGAKAAADAIKKDVTAIENFMSTMIRFVQSMCDLCFTDLHGLFG
jgi:hypothetical protein